VGSRFLTCSVVVAEPYGAAVVFVPQEGVAATRAPSDHGRAWTMTLRVYQADAPMRVNPTGCATEFGDQVWGTGMALISVSVSRVGGRPGVMSDGTPEWMASWEGDTGSQHRARWQPFLTDRHRARADL